MCQECLCPNTHVLTMGQECLCPNAHVLTIEHFPTHIVPKHVYAIAILFILDLRPSYAGINLTGYHPPPGLTAGPLIFSVKIPTLRTAFQCKTPAPGQKTETKIPTPGHNLPFSNAKRSMKRNII